MYVTNGNLDSTGDAFFKLFVLKFSNLAGSEHLKPLHKDCAVCRAGPFPPFEAV